MGSSGLESPRVHVVGPCPKAGGANAYFYRDPQIAAPRNLSFRPEPNLDLDSAVRGKAPCRRPSLGGADRYLRGIDCWGSAPSSHVRPPFDDL